MQASISKIIFTLLAVISISTLNAQQVTFDELVNGNTEVKSSTKKWINELNSAETNEVAKEILKAELVKLGDSRHWLSISANGEISNDISFQTSKKMYLDRVVKDLKEAGFTLTNTKQEDNSTIFIYAKDGMTVEVLALSTETTSQTVYLVTLL